MARPTLLLADGSPAIRRIIELTFAGEDVQVVTVDDGGQALARIPIERPDIVLADIGLTTHSGYEIAAFVRSRPDLTHIPVVLLAGAFEVVDDARAMQSGSAGVLVKPLEPSHVIARVRALVGGATSRSTWQPALASVQPRRERSESWESEDEGPTPTLADLLGEASGERPLDASLTFAFPADPMDLPLHEPPVVPSSASPVTAPAEPSAGVDELVDRVTARVLAQLFGDSGLAKPLLARVVAEVAERLVREAIEEEREVGNGGK